MMSFIRLVNFSRGGQLTLLDTHCLNQRPGGLLSIHFLYIYIYIADLQILAFVVRDSILALPKMCQGYICCNFFFLSPKQNSVNCASFEQSVLLLVGTEEGKELQRMSQFYSWPIKLLGSFCEQISLGTASSTNSLAIYSP